MLVTTHDSQRRYQNAENDPESRCSISALWGVDRVVVAKIQIMNRSGGDRQRKVETLENGHSYTHFQGWLMFGGLRGSWWNGRARLSGNSASPNNM
jgi:hypothetical protein